jgi:hypothetical protein
MVSVICRSCWTNAVGDAHRRLGRFMTRRHPAARWSPAVRARLGLGQEVVFQTGWQEAIFSCLLLLNRL